MESGTVANITPWGDGDISPADGGANVRFGATAVDPPGSIRVPGCPVRFRRSAADPSEAIRVVAA